MSKTSHNVEAFLAIDSTSKTVEELSRLIGVRPDKCWEMGSEYLIAENVRRHAFSRWCICECGENAYAYDEVAAALLQRIQPMSASISELPAHVRVAFSMCVTQENGVFGWGLAREQVSLLARIGAEIDISFVVKT